MLNPKQEWKDALLEEVAPQVLDGEFVTEDTVPIVRDALLERYEENAPGSFAGEVVVETLDAGVGHWLRAVKRKVARGAVHFVQADGSVRRWDNMPVRAIPKVREDGERVHQQKLWLEMSPAEFRLMYQGIIALATTHSVIAAALGKVQNAIQQHPDAETAGDACRMAGIDPADIQVRVDDLRRLLG